MKFSESDEFKKEFKKLAKKYHTLEDDFSVLKKAITAAPAGNGAKHWNKLKHDGEDTYVMKIRMMCRTVKGAQFRVIYFYNGSTVEVLFIEMYFKGNKEREDGNRIEEIFNSMQES